MAESDAPERIWLLKSVVTHLGVKDFLVPPQLRHAAVGYVRDDVAAVDASDWCDEALRELAFLSGRYHAEQNHRINVLQCEEGDCLRFRDLIKRGNSLQDPSTPDAVRQARRETQE